MKLVLQDEHEELRQSIRRLLSERSPSAAVREVMESETGYDRDLWRLLSEMGVLGLVIPDEFGGAAAGHVERAIVLEELGRAVVPTPFLASAVLAADTILALDDQPAQTEWLPAIASGDLIATVAVAEGDGSWPRDGGSVTATQTETGWVLDGAKKFVVAGNVADLVLVYARTVDGPAWFSVASDAESLSMTTMATLDPTRRMSHVGFSATPARRLQCADAAAVLDHVGDLATVALGAEQVGGLQRAMEMTVDYAKIRVQFGRVIGSYQAVKHGCAEMYSAWEHSLSVARYAAWAADESPSELPVAAALARVYIGPAYFQVAANTIQFHGGIGFTWEHDAHLYYKRAKSTELFFGTPDRNRALLADLLEI